jgi:hypothetical protein
LYIQPRLGIVLLFNSTNICHGTVGSSGFWQLGVALFSKEIILKRALEYEQLAKEALKDMNFLKGKELVLRGPKKNVKKSKGLML